MLQAADRDALFEHVHELYPDLRIEMDEAGAIYLIAPGSIASSLGSSEVFTQLALWAKRDKTGKALDASVIYSLPNGSKMCPDASWIPKSVLAETGKAALATITAAAITPSFVVEVRSPSDRLADQIQKCELWRSAGVPEVWLVDPIEQTVRVFFTGLEVVLSVQPSSVTSRTLPGFTLDCDPVWNG